MFQDKLKAEKKDKHSGNDLAAMIEFVANSLMHHYKLRGVVLEPFKAQHIAQRIVPVLNSDR